VPRKWTPKDDVILRRLNKAGKTLGAVSRETGWAMGTVSKRARALGLSWANNMPPEMIAAQAANTAAVRADVINGMWEQAQHQLARLLKDEFYDLARGEYGVEEMRKFVHLPSRSVRDLTAAITSLSKAAATIENMSKANQDSSDLRAFLGFMAGGTVTTSLDISGGDHASGSDEGVHGEP
jgi:lambda repressor-like predicted transcriptional regulator